MSTEFVDDMHEVTYITGASAERNGLWSNNFTENRKISSFHNPV
jgi:hypothetical protein